MSRIAKTLLIKRHTSCMHCVLFIFISPGCGYRVVSGLFISGLRDITSRETFVGESHVF